ncbi:MAG: type II toxin-antitoxin system RelE/ParE family toxin [Deltaproteobacteria bacterium]|nr:type II toxin-antitoxin system RelE/ParE family toxin [Deltaproteobacteria bacterium]
MPSLRVEVSATAERQLRGLPREDQLRVVRAIGRLAEEPHPRGCRKLAGYRDVFRIRVGLYRVLYSVDRAKIVVVILKVGHRKDVYR